MLRSTLSSVVFPEAFISAYPKGLHFGAPLGERTPEGREGFRRYFESAIEVPLSSMQHIAMEGRCFVLSACQHLRRSDAPDNYAGVQGNHPDTVLMRGGSCIVAPLGAVLAGPVFDEDALLVHELDLADLARGKYDFDVAGHYARPDVFRLHVNEAPTVPVVFEQSP